MHANKALDEIRNNFLVRVDLNYRVAYVHSVHQDISDISRYEVTAWIMACHSCAVYTEDEIRAW